MAKVYGEEIDTSDLTKVEIDSLNEEPEKADEPETTSEEPKVEKEESSPPEPEPKDEAEPQSEVDTKPETEPSPRVDGILTKDGKNVIPFSVLEQERAERQRLKAEIEELKKPKAEPRVEAEPTPKPEEEIDFTAIAAKAYESQEGMAEALKTMFEAGKKAAETVGSSAAQRQSLTERFHERVDKIKADNPWIKGPVEDFVTEVATKKMRSDPKFNGNDLNSLVRVTEEAINEVKSMLNPAKPVDESKIREDERKKVTEELMQKFNITKPRVETLSGLRSINPEILSKFEAIDAMNSIDYEEAYFNLTPKEREAFDARGKK